MTVRHLVSRWARPCVKALGQRSRTIEEMGLGWAASSSHRRIAKVLRAYQFVACCGDLDARDRCAVLNSAELVAFVATSDPSAAQAFYGEVLGFPLVTRSEFASVFDCKGTTLRVTVVDAVVPAPYTVLGWSVDDISDTVQTMKERGITFLRFEGMEQDALAIWHSPSGAQVAWFKDPEGNILSITQP
jgi:catechol 2,3-dioxygenase-like lactoylglutathione lyase family enzyme